MKVAVDRAHCAGETGEEAMLVSVIGDNVYVRLSRRNLRQLDAILEQPDAGNRYLARKDENGMSLVVQVEDDADHYEGRSSGAGLGERLQWA